MKLIIKLLKEIFVTPREALVFVKGIIAVIDNCRISKIYKNSFLAYLWGSVRDDLKTACYNGLAVLAIIPAYWLLTTFLQDLFLGRLGIPGVIFMLPGGLVLLGCFKQGVIVRIQTELWAANRAAIAAVQKAEKKAKVQAEADARKAQEAEQEAKKAEQKVDEAEKTSKAPGDDFDEEGECDDLDEYDEYEDEDYDEYDDDDYDEYDDDDEDDDYYDE